MTNHPEIQDGEKLKRLPPREMFQAVCDALGAHFPIGQTYHIQFREYVRSTFADIDVDSLLKTT